MFARLTVLCVFLLLVAVTAQLPKYKAIAEKSPLGVKPQSQLYAYIKDRQCDALIAYPDVLPCKPNALRVEVIDSAAFPDVQIKNFTTVVRRVEPCIGNVPVNVFYSCPLLGKKAAKKTDRRSYGQRTYGLSLPSAEASSSSSEEIMSQRPRPGDHGPIWARRAGRPGQIWTNN